MANYLGTSVVVGERLVTGHNQRALERRDLLTHRESGVTFYDLAPVRHGPTGSARE